MAYLLGIALKNSQKKYHRSDIFFYYFFTIYLFPLVELFVKAHLEYQVQT